MVCAYLQKAGYYNLEVWGAEGGGEGGYGGYSFGKIHSETGSSLYVVVGGKGAKATYWGAISGWGDGTYTWSGGYNGGGDEIYSNSAWGAGGGGATHIATRTGVLSSLSSYISNVLIVAGGGGGHGYSTSANSRLSSGGGHVGGGPLPGTQTGSSGPVPGTFGKGARYTSGGHPIGGGGGGLYGGGSYHDSGSAEGSPTGTNYSSASSSGGSGYIGNSLLSNKGMYMYSASCNASNAAETKTTCTSSAGHAVANAANTGNGYARITYLGT